LRIEAERHNQLAGGHGGKMLVARVARDAAIEAGGVVAQRMWRAWNRQRASEFFAFHPILEFTRRVARVVADFEPGEHDHLWGDLVNAAGGVHCGGEQQGQAKQYATQFQRIPSKNTIDMPESKCLKFAM